MQNHDSSMIESIKNSHINENTEDNENTIMNENTEENEITEDNENTIMNENTEENEITEDNEKSIISGQKNKGEIAFDNFLDTCVLHHDQLMSFVDGDVEKLHADDKTMMKAYNVYINSTELLDATKILFQEYMIVRKFSSSMLSLMLAKYKTRYVQTKQEQDENILKQIKTDIETLENEFYVSESEKKENEQTRYEKLKIKLGLF